MQRIPKRSASTRNTFKGFLLGSFLVGASLTPASASATEGLLLTSDYQKGRVRITDLAQNAVVYDFSVRSSVMWPGCGRWKNGCALLGMQYSNHDDRDFLDLMGTRMVFQAEEPSLYTHMPSFITRVEIDTSPRQIFRMEYLDFRDIDNRSDHCDQSDDELYGSLGKKGCSLQMGHGLNIVSEDFNAKTVTWVVADALNGRVMKISLDYSTGSNIGHVDWAIGAEHPDWPSLGLVNNARYYVEDDGNYVLITYFSDGDGDVQGTSAGSIKLFKESADGLSEVWRFPDLNTDASPFLHAAHMAQILTDPNTGDRFLYYAHGRAMATGFNTDGNTDLGGALGVLRLGSSIQDTPHYLGEAIPFFQSTTQEDPAFRYARDIDFTNDGRMILSDASCETFCPEAGKHFLVNPFSDDMNRSSLSGIFSSTHTEQDILDLDQRYDVETLYCGHGGIFESHYLAPGEEGRHLRRAKAGDNLLSCEAESVDQMRTQSRQSLGEQKSK